ncbi:inverse autotransporter beta domain-containing protein [Salmonella enterica]|nr:inverse autotransporter beta domain-containing protein [Salmonella enterica]
MPINSLSLSRYVSWGLIISQISLPAVASYHTGRADNGVRATDTWLAQTTSLLAPQLQDNNLSEYARQQLKAYPESLTNDALNKGFATFLPDAKFRGGISLQDGTKYRSAEADLLLPIWENTSSIIFGQLGFRDHDSSSFNGRTFVNAGMGYRQTSGQWLLGTSAFLDSDIRNSHLRGGLGLEAFRDTFSVSGNYYFPLSGWRASAYQAFHDERPAYGFDVRMKGALPSFPWLGAELTFEQYYGDKVDLLGNDTLTRDPSAIGAALSWRPIPLLEVRVGYRDAGSGGTQAEGSINLNYSFGSTFKEQLDTSNITAATNAVNRTAFVDRNYDIVMEYREQASRIRITAPALTGRSGNTLTLQAQVNSRYPIEKIEWSGDAELLAGLKTQGSINSGLQLPVLPLTVQSGKEYGLFLTVTDSRGTTVTSERIPVTVLIDENSFRSDLNVINPGTKYTDGHFVIPASQTTTSNSEIVEWHYVRARSQEEWISLTPESVKYTTDMAGVTLKPLKGELRDGHWVERVQVEYNSAISSAPSDTLRFSITATGSDGSQPLKSDVQLLRHSNLLSTVTSVAIQYTPGSEELNGSTVAPVVGSVLQTKTLCNAAIECTDQFEYQWEISPDGSNWHNVPGATSKTWIMPAQMNGQSLQNMKVRVRVTSDNQEQP